MRAYVARRTKEVAALLAIWGGLVAAIGAQPAPPLVRLYAIDCGRLDYQDMDGFADTDDYARQAGSLVVPCFLIRHGEDWLLWDTGVGDRIAAMPDGEVKQGARFTLRKTLSAQLATIGLTPADIRYVALSHLHADHAGNIGLFPQAVFLVSRAELGWASGSPAPTGVEASLIAPLFRAQIDPLDDDRDVFGDQTVRILKAPGHTPGHRMLLVSLPESGRLLISGDLVHQRQSLRSRLVPRVNVSRADTLASMDRLDGIAKATGARIVIMHERHDFEALPVFPAYLK